MFRLTQNRWFRRVALGAVAAVGLGAVALPTAPAQARVVVGFGVPGYYAPPAPYYGPYPYSYSPYAYPYYGYPAGGVYFNFGGGHHWRR